VLVSVLCLFPPLLQIQSQIEAPMKTTIERPLLLSLILLVLLFNSIYHTTNNIYTCYVAYCTSLCDSVASTYCS
jgi:hypothetical protein